MSLSLLRLVYLVSSRGPRPSVEARAGWKKRPQCRSSQRSSGIRLSVGTAWVGAWVVGGGMGGGMGGGWWDSFVGWNGIGVVGGGMGGG